MWERSIDNLCFYDESSHNSLRKCHERKDKIAFLALRNSGQSSWQMSSGILYHTNIYSLCQQGYDFSSFLPFFSRNNGLVHTRQSWDYWYNHKLKWDTELCSQKSLPGSLFEVINDAQHYGKMICLQLYEATGERNPFWYWSLKPPKLFESEPLGEKTRKK